jgi:outer membrane receptor protein involved in Fe transport
MTRTLAYLLTLVATAAGAGEPNLDDLAALLDTNVVSSASRASERADDAPATITTVTADQLKRLGLRSLHEAINFLSVGMVAQDPLHSVEVGVRGVLLTADYGSHVLVVVDGHVLNEQWNGTAYFEQGLGIPVEFIDRIELSVGPGSVLYGSSAMLGVINVVTKRASDLGRLQVTLEGSLLPPQGVDAAPQLRWGFGGTGRASLLTGWDFTLAGAPLEVALGLEYYAHRGQSLTYAPQTGLTETDGTTTWPQSWGARAPGPGSWGGTTTDSWSTQVPSGLLKVRWGDFTLWLRGALSSRSMPAYDTLGVGTDFDQQAIERDLWAGLDLRWQRAVAERVGLSARLYADVYDYLGASQSSSWLLNGGDQLPAGADPAHFTYRQDYRAGSRWAGAELQVNVDWLGDGRFPLLAGADLRLKSFHDATTYSTVQGAAFDTVNAYDVNEWQLGWYLQQRAQLHQRLHANVGLRVDRQKGLDAHPSPRAALVWSTPWDAHVKAVFSTAFRTPSGYERFAQYTGALVSNPALSPETVMTGELGYEQRLGRHRVSVIGFVSSFKQMIREADLLDSAGVALHEYQNVGELLNVGAQGIVEGTVGQFTYAASFTGAVNQTSTALVASPNWFGNARVGYDLGEGRPRVSLLANFSGPRLITQAMASSVDAAGNAVHWAPGTEWASPQLELRAVVQADLAALKGLWVRGVVGGNVFPFSPYVVGPRQVPAEGADVPALSPNSRLFVLVSLGWTLGP